MQVNTKVRNPQVYIQGKLLSLALLTTLIQLGRGLRLVAEQDHSVSTLLCGSLAKK